MRHRRLKGYKLSATNVVFNPFHLPINIIKSLLSAKKWVFRQQDFQMLHPKVNRYE